MLIDSHCHIHDPEFKLNDRVVLERAESAGVGKIICVGTSANDSQAAVDYVKDKPSCWAAVGLHPHGAKLGEDDYELLTRLAGQPKVVAIGECGLDYYYNHSGHDDQKQALRYQLQLAQTVNKPCIFHVREAYADFWPIFDEFPGVRGVIHSFSAAVADLEQALGRGLYIGLNGIMTFTKDEAQLAAAKAVPLDKLLLETDAPFLTPTPKRGTINEPANVQLVARFLCELRGESIDQLAAATTHNAEALFMI